MIKSNKKENREFIVLLKKSIMYFETYVGNLKKYILINMNKLILTLFIFNHLSIFTIIIEYRVIFYHRNLKNSRRLLLIIILIIK